MDAALRKTIEDILARTNDMSIATVRPDGWPQTTTVSYVSDGLTIYFVTGEHAQKARNIAINNKVSATIDRPYKNWNSILSLSLGGVATAVTDKKEITHVEKLMTEKFPQAADIEMPDEAPAVFKITPKVISVLDYSKGFGHTDMVTL